MKAVAALLAFVVFAVVASPVFAADPSDEAFSFAQDGYLAMLAADFTGMLIGFGQALETDPQPEYFKGVDEALMRLAARSEIEPASNALSKIKARNPSLRNTVLGLARWYLRDKAGAERLFLNAANIDRDNALAFVQLAELYYFGSGNIVKARLAYKKALATSDRTRLNVWAKSIAKINLAALH